EAAQRGLLDRVATLLESGVEVTSRDKENCTALHWAAIKNHLAVARLLVEKGAEIDAAGGELTATPLHWAARSGNVQIVTYLISRGADPSL
ncbi:ankyrin repeat-containing domain protein, partial [Zopfochytrium polystomum]